MLPPGDKVAMEHGGTPEGAVEMATTSVPNRDAKKPREGRDRGAGVWRRSAL